MDAAVNAPVDPHAWAAWIDAAHREGRLLDAPEHDLDLTAAYAVQDRLTARREARGARRIGWKLGYTSAVMREQMGVDTPNLGPLLDTMVVEPGGAVPPTLVQPRVEPEIGLVVGADGGPAEARAVLEVVDSVWRDYRFTLATNTADGSSAAGVVVGPVLDGDLAALTVELRRGDDLEATGRGDAAMGHPHHALDWLRGAIGGALRPGDLVITGGLTRAVPLGPGEVVEARFPGATVAVQGAR
ncbi:fumarylacetoacetate hydrolase family protein [Actinomycetospora sp. NBRC 106375]|uniref:2-keto-4-pentenoate hydratase n=1 Tax=Actinomycetospora sp. NBRC 106375 TaxID=3032207 RepID=UPI00255336C0|nr:fumarylacetoacetate hydrolase family protein [Actinomycetospora sp. NBRC 106375]